MPDSVSLKVNGKAVRLNVDGERALLWVLRTDLGLTGTKVGCGEGHCGACTVLLDGVAVRSCLRKVKDVKGKEIVTIEGLETEGKLHPLQKAFMEHDALQCGFCTPGMILTAFGPSRRIPSPRESKSSAAWNRISAGAALTRGSLTPLRQRRVK